MNEGQAIKRVKYVWKNTKWLIVVFFGLALVGIAAELRSMVALSVFALLTAFLLRIWLAGEGRDSRTDSAWFALAVLSAIITVATFGWFVLELLSPILAP
jgi:hypothetical protein